MRVITNQYRRSIPVYALMIVLYAITSAEVIDLTNGGVDLGRHLKDGELLLSPAASQILHTNFYSYAQPDREFVNHHWLAGIVFQAVYKLGGFPGLNAFYILLGELTLGLFLRMAEKAAGLAVASALALALMPILRARASVRPEIFTLLLAGVFFWLLWSYHDGGLSWAVLLVLPALEVFWVNLHIGFIFGPIFVVAFLLGELVEGPRNHPGLTTHQKPRRLGRWLAILGLTLAATLLNPSGIHGAVYPLTIWTNYGIPVVENLSIPFLWSHGYHGEFALITLTLMALYLSFLATRRPAPFPTALFILAAVIGELAFTAIRNQTLLAHFSLAAIAINIGARGFERWRERRAGAVVLGAFMLASICYNGLELMGRKQTIGLGLQPGRDAAARFFAANHVPGPLLNNFNLGGYLIHYLFPQQRVYVDSRPEAYDSSFLRDRYQAPLTEDHLWPGLLSKYGFQSIFFCASSVWENAFIDRRIADPEWALVFGDETAIILVRRTAANAALIERSDTTRKRLLRLGAEHTAQPPL
jgi:hypothetical protein